MSTVCIRISFVLGQFKKPFPNICKEISQTNARLKVVQVVVVPVDADKVVVEIISVEVEVAAVVNTSPTIMLWQLLFS